MGKMDKKIVLVDDTKQKYVLKELIGSGIISEKEVYVVSQWISAPIAVSLVSPKLVIGNIYSDKESGYILKRLKKIRSKSPKMPVILLNFYYDHILTGEVGKQENLGTLYDRLIDLDSSCEINDENSGMIVGHDSAFLARPKRKEAGYDTFYKALNFYLRLFRSTDWLSEEFLRRIDPKNRLDEHEKRELYDGLNTLFDLKLKDIEGIISSEEGYTSKSGFEFMDKFIKADLVSRLRHEHKVYSLDLMEFNYFRANMNEREFVVGQDLDIAIMAMDNLKMHKPGIIKANSIKSHMVREFTKHGLGYNLFLMSLFHKEATRHIDQFCQIMYQGVNGLPHWEEGNIPYRNTKGTAYRRFIDTKIDSKAVIPAIQQHRELQKIIGNTVIHGDWKPENMVNGHLVDYAMVGKGFEVDEMAYYLSDSNFNLGLNDFHRLIEEYIFLRNTHDARFRVKVDKGYRQTMHQLADSAFLSQLVLRHSVMNKRDLSDDSKFEQRQYYQNAINQVLKDGKFK